MGRADYLALGDYNATCSICGSKYKASELKKHWQGWYRCVDCWEPRQPQDFVRGVADIQAVPWSQPESVKTIEYCTITGSSAIPGLAIPGCMLPGQTMTKFPGGNYSFCTPTSVLPQADVGTSDCAAVGAVPSF